MKIRLKIFANVTKSKTFIHGHEIRANDRKDNKGYIYNYKDTQERKNVDIQLMYIRYQNLVKKKKK